MNAHLRLARPVGDLDEAERMYRQGLSLPVLARFDDHEGFDGVMLGEPGAAWHLELTRCRRHPLKPAPTPEDLLVFYLPDTDAWRSRCGRLRDAGFREVEPFNPYWSRQGRTFADADGYRVVIQRSAWSAPAT